MLESIEKALNKQLNEELYSWYLYLSMASWFEDKGYQGFAAWMHAQAQEEMIHAMKFYHFISDRNGRVILQQIKTPKNEWSSPLNIFEESLAHEQYITGCINDLVTEARKSNDHATDVFLQWFVTEQVEEEDNVGTFVDRLKMVEGAPGGLFMMDQEAGNRPRRRRARS